MKNVNFSYTYIILIYLGHWLPERGNSELVDINLGGLASSVESRTLGKAAINRTLGNMLVAHWILPVSRHIRGMKTGDHYLHVCLGGQVNTGIPPLFRGLLRFGRIKSQTRAKGILGFLARG